MSALELIVAHQIDQASADEVEQLRGRVSEVDGTEGLSEHKRMELEAATVPVTTPTTDPAAGRRFVAVLARSVADGHLIGYGQASRAGGDDAGYGIELLVDPEHLRPATEDGPPDDGLADQLLGVVLEETAELATAVGPGPQPVRYWVSHATSVDDHRARAHGLAPDRDLLQMRRTLPVEDDHRPRPATRPFRPGADEAAWLRTNNRAFAGHPEQGNWDAAMLAEREQEPWFDPDGLLLYEVDGRVAGSCWTKVHTDTVPPLGEIYVISVDPDFHGQGLGRALTRAGLDHLASVGITMGMLYVDGGNVAAVSLYRSMGFVEHHTDRAYLGTVG